MTSASRTRDLAASISSGHITPVPSADERSRGRQMRGRGIAAIALSVLAGILLAYGGTLLYVRQELGREKPFAARLVSSLDDPNVRGVVAERTVDALEAGPARDLLPFRPVVLAAVDALVRTSPFKRIATFGIADAHRALVTEKSSVTVEVEGAG